MNKLTTIRKLALFAALPAAVLAANNAMAGVDVYGKINLTMQNNSADNDNGTTKADLIDNYTLDTNASRLGFKSSADLGSTGLKGIAKLEYEVDVDDGATVLGQRNIYAGVQGDFGTLVAGKFDTPMKESQGKADLFNDYILGDIKNVLLVGEDRASNIIMYSTPDFDGVGVNIAIMPGEEKGITGSDQNNGIADYVSANVHYDSEKLYLALAHNTASPPTAATASGAEITRLVAQVKMDAFTVGAIYQMADSADNNNATAVNAIGNFSKDAFGDTLNWNTDYKDQDGYIVNASYAVDDSNTVKVQYGSSTATTVTGPATDVKNGDLDITLLSLGYDYKLGKNAMIFAYYSDYQAEHKTTAGVKRELNADTFAVGYELKF